MKVGDLVRHAHEDVIGIVIEGPVSYEVVRTEPDSHYPYYKVHWFDGEFHGIESARELIVISSN